MVKVKRERDDQSVAAAASVQQTARAANDNDSESDEQQPRKRQKQQPQQHLSFSIESIMRGGNNLAQSTTGNKQTQSTNQNHKPKREALAVDTAARLRCGGVESPGGSSCSSVRSNGNLSQSSSRCRSGSPFSLSNNNNINMNQDDARDILVDQDEDEVDEAESRCDSAASRLSSPISPGNQVSPNGRNLNHSNQAFKPINSTQLMNPHQHLNHHHNPQQQPSTNQRTHNHMATTVKLHHSNQQTFSSSTSNQPAVAQQSSSSTTIIGGDQQASASLQGVGCVLENKNDWNRFHSLNTEMIITKTGRRMFPVMKVQFSNLDPNRQYAVSMDIVPVDNKRYRYAYHKSCWQVAGKADPSAEPRLYPHPDSPFMGDLLARQVISFEKVKLTNNEMDKSGHIILNSMHKYQPRIHLIDFGTPNTNTTTSTNSNNNNLNSKPNMNNNNKNYQSSTSAATQHQQPQRKIDIEGYRTFVFSETVFTAVTAYQNQLITKLKIEKNPFAKGFRDSSRLSDLDRGDAFDYLGHSMGASGSRYMPGMPPGGGLGGPSALEFAAAAASAAGSHMDAYHLVASAAAMQQQQHQQQHQQLQQQQQQQQQANPHQISSQAAQFQATQLWLAAAFSACLNGAGANALAAAAAPSGASDSSGAGAGNPLGGPSSNSSSAAIN